MEADRSAIVIRRDDLPGMSRAVTVRVAVPDPALVADFEPGSRVSFEYTSRAFGTPTLVRLARGDQAPGVHDHTPHHGGVVAMVGMHHVEARVDADGEVHAWITDFYRRPIPLDAVRGTATLESEGTVRDTPLAVDGDGLGGKTEPFPGTRVTARVTVIVDGDPIAADLVLPVAAGASGVASVMQTRCTPGTGQDMPRCTLAVSQAVSALAVSPDGTNLVIAVEGGAVSVWHLPDVSLVGGIDPAPPVATPAGQEPRPELVSRVVWRPDGREIAIVLEGRVLRYAMPSGRLLRTLSGPGLVVRDVAWWSDGSRLVVTADHDPQAHALDVETGRDVAQFEVKLEGAAIAIEPGGETLLVGSEAGTVTRFRARDGKRLDTFAAGNRAVLSVVRDGDALVVLGQDGIVRALAADDGTQRAIVATGDAPTRFAAGPDGRVALGLSGGRTVVVDPRAGTITRRLGTGEKQITAVAWHGRTIVTGDESGRVAVWDVE